MEASTLEGAGSLLQDPSPAVLTTYRLDGTALTSPVWFRYRAGAFEVVIAEGDVHEARASIAGRYLGAGAGERVWDLGAILPA